MKKRYGLEQKCYPKHSQWKIDQDYITSLNNEEKNWLDKFNQEYYKGNIKKGDKTALHNTDELRKECYRRNERAKYDTFNVKTVSNQLVNEHNMLDDEGKLTSTLNNITDLRQVLLTEQIELKEINKNKGN